MITLAVRELLAGDGAVAGLVGERIHPGRLPQNPTFPALVYSVLPPSHARAAADGDTGQRETWLELAFYGRHYADVEAGLAALTALLVGYRGGSIERIDVDSVETGFEQETRWDWGEVVIKVMWKSD